MNKFFLASIFLCCVTLLAISTSLVATSPSGINQSFGYAGQATSTPDVSAAAGMPPILDRLAQPPTVYPPMQADLGQQTYYLVCMTCHGDRGQGLTDEFRALIGTPESNCWQSHCHASNHPREGFVFPHEVPPVVSDVIREQFTTALQLHNFIAAKMPYQAPGSLSSSDYWNLTAYLLRANGVMGNVAFLDEQTAASIILAKPTAQPTPVPLFLLVALVLGVGLIFLLVIVIRIYGIGRK